MRLALTLALLAAAPALAQPRSALAQPKPATMPTRDVDVLYAVHAGPGALTQRTRFDVQSHRIRIDPPTTGLYFVVDERNRRMEMVVPESRTVVQMPYDPARIQGGLADGNATRLGDDTIAGLPCTEWQTTDNAHRPVTVCVTDDGVTLRARSGANVIVLATKVTYGPLDPSIFAIPADYRRQTAPRGQPRGEP